MFCWDLESLPNHLDVIEIYYISMVKLGHWANVKSSKQQFEVPAARERYFVYPSKKILRGLCRRIWACVDGISLIHGQVHASFSWPVGLYKNAKPAWREQMSVNTGPLDGPVHLGWAYWVDHVYKQKRPPCQFITSFQSKVHIEGICTEQNKTNCISQHTYQLASQKIKLKKIYIKKRRFTV